MKDALILFTRVPIPGQTKTRLMPFLTGEECARLHACFVKDIYEKAKQVDADIFVFFTPKDEKKLLQQVLDNETVCCITAIVCSILIRKIIRDVLISERLVSVRGSGSFRSTVMSFRRRGFHLRHLWKRQRNFWNWKQCHFRQRIISVRSWMQRR